MSGRDDDTTGTVSSHDDTDGAADTQPDRPQPNGATAGQSRPSVTDLATDPLTKLYVKFVVACFALVGVAAGLAVVFVGFVGGTPLTSSLLGLADMAAVDPGPTMDQLYVNRLAFQAMNTAPVVAGVLGVAAGLYTANNLDGSDRHSYVASALGGGIGAAVLVVAVGVFSSVAISEIPIPQAALDSAGSTASLTTMDGFSSASQGVSAVLSTAYIGGTKLAFDSLVFNAVAVGVGVAIVAAASAYVSREFAPTN